MGGWIWKNGQMDGQMDGRMEGCMEKKKEGRLGHSAYHKVVERSLVWESDNIGSRLYDFSEVTYELTALIFVSVQWIRMLTQQDC